MASSQADPHSASSASNALSVQATLSGIIRRRQENVPVDLSGTHRDYQHIIWRVHPDESLGHYHWRPLSMGQPGNNRMTCYPFAVLCWQPFNKPWYQVADIDGIFSAGHFWPCKWNEISVVQAIAGVSVSFIGDASISVVSLGWDFAPDELLSDSTTSG